MRSSHFTPLAALVVLASACASTSVTEEAPAAPAATPPAAAATPPAAASPEAGLFTSAQAERGQEQFVESCSECHSSSEFRGRQFEFSWGRRSVGDLYRHVFDNMPEDAPASLTPQQYVDVIAYILEINDFPDGDQELPADEAILGTYPLTPPSGN